MSEMDYWRRRLWVANRQIKQAKRWDTRLRNEGAKREIELVLSMLRRKQNGNLSKFY